MLRDKAEDIVVDGGPSFWNFVRRLGLPHHTAQVFFKVNCIFVGNAGNWIYE